MGVFSMKSDGFYCSGFVRYFTSQPVDQVVIEEEMAANSMVTTGSQVPLPLRHKGTTSVPFSSSICCPAHGAKHA
jgi:hypothetical protein